MLVFGVTVSLALGEVCCFSELRPVLPTGCEGAIVPPLDAPDMAPGYFNFMSFEDCAKAAPFVRETITVSAIRILLMVNLVCLNVLPQRWRVQAVNASILVMR